MSDLEILAREALAGSGFDVAELHGAVVGIGVCDLEQFNLQDLVDLLGADVLSDAERVVEFIGATLDALYAEDMSFKLLLSDDDAPMSERLQALAGWSHGFLTGLVAGLNRQGREEERSEQLQEIIRDFVAISQLDPDSEDESEEDFMQLEEYVKVGVLLIMSLHNDVDKDVDQDTDHDVDREE